MASLAAESKGLIDEIDRIGKATAFNGQLLLDGSFRSLQLQDGANVDQTIRMGKLPMCAPPACPQMAWRSR